MRRLTKQEMIDDIISAHWAMSGLQELSGSYIYAKQDRDDATRITLHMGVDEEGGGYEERSVLTWNRKDRTLLFEGE